MALNEILSTITLIAGADLSAAQFHVVKVNASGQAVLCGAGEAGVGVLQNAPASGQAATIALFSGCKMKAIAGGALATIGVPVASNASGRLKAATLGATTSSSALGILLETAGADGDIVTILGLHMGALPATAT